LGSNSDPEYAYLFNSLNFVHWLPVGHFDHPGTPLQMMGACVLIIVRLTRGGHGLVNDVLSNPELYLNAINFFLISILFLTILFGGFLVYRLTKKIFLGIIFQMTPFLSTTSIWTFNRISPELLLLITGMWFALIIFYFYYKKKENSLLAVICLSLITGFSIATKINSLPLILLGLVFFTFRNKILYILGTVISFVLFTWPIHNNYKIFYNWIIRLITHSGMYGSGDEKFIDIAIFGKNFMQVVYSEGFLIITIIIIFVYLIFLFREKNKINYYSSLVGVLLFFLSQIFIVSKHLSIHYLVPALSFLGITYVIFGTILLKQKNRFSKILIPIIFASLIIVSINNVWKIYDSTRGYQQNYIEAKDIESFKNKNYKESFIVYYYRSSSKEYALYFGNIYSGNAYTDLLNEMYSRSYFYDIWRKTFSRWNWWNKLVNLPSNKTIIFQGTPFKNSYLQFAPDFTLQDIYNGNTETLYLFIK